MEHKTILVWCQDENDLGRAIGKPLAIFDSAEDVRQWLKNENNLNSAMHNPESFTPAVTWEIHNEGSLHYGHYESEGFQHALLICPIRDFTKRDNLP